MVRRTARLLGCCLAYGLSHSSVASDVHDPGEEHREIEEVVVTASPLDRSGDELAVPVSTVRREHLLAHPGSSLGETLAREPGIVTTGFAAGASRPVIRGQDAFRVQILENGIGAHDVSAVSPDHGVPVNPLTAQRVEIVRGPAAVRYGGGALGGVVNSLTNRVPRAMPERRLEGELLAAYGFGARQRDAAFLLEGGRGPLAWHLDGVSRDSDDYDVAGGPEDELDFTAADGYSLAAGGAWIGGRGRLGAAVARFANVYGIPGPEDPDAPASIDLDKTYWELEGELRAPAPGFETLRFRGAASDYMHDEVVEGEGIVAAFDNDEWEARLELVHAPAAGLTGAVGLHARRRDLEARGEGAEFLLPTDTWTRAAFLFEEVALGDCARLQLGGRVEETRVEGTPSTGGRRTRHFHPLGASAGVVLELGSSVDLGLTVAALQRAPDPVELYARGPHEATGTFEIGDPGLDEERARNVDLTLRGAWRRLDAELGAFYTDYDGYVFGELSGRTCDEAGSCFAGDVEELDELRYVQRDVAFYGGELSGNLELLDLGSGHLGLDFQADFVRARLARGGNLPRIPPLRYGLGLHYGGDRLQARLGFLRTTTQHRSAEGERDTGGSTSVDAYVRYRLLDAGEGRALDLSASGTNLFDDDGRNHVSFKKDDVVMPARNVRLGVHGRF